jgi:hypothetical protein
MVAVVTPDVTERSIHPHPPPHSACTSCRSRRDTFHSDLGGIAQVENYRAHARPSAPLPASINFTPQSPIPIAAT